MKKNGKQVLFLGGIFIIAFAIWTALIQMVDVQPLGQNATNIGFATFNCWFHRLTNVNMTIYTITDWMGLIPLVVCLIFAGIGLVQLIKRRSLFKVDPDIIILGVYYVIVILAYFIFEIIPINYRPILINGIMEASYPSSTTLLVLCVMPTLVEQIQRRMSCSTLKRIITILAIAFSAFMVIGRLISGVHWFTDIVGGVLLSAGLFTVYKAVVKYNNMALSDAEALKMDRSAAAENICGCAFCILTMVQTDGFDRYPRFLRRHEVCYMEAYHRSAP